MSVHAHHGVEQSRRDDMEAIGYMLVYFMKGGKLPWMGLKIDDIRERYKTIGHKKEEVFTTKLCSGIHREFGTYLRYVKTLKFTDKPDYSYLRNLFRNCLRTNNWSDDDVFDWMKLRSSQPSPNLRAPTDKVIPMIGDSPHHKSTQKEKQEIEKYSKADPEIVINPPKENSKHQIEKCKDDSEEQEDLNNSFGNITSVQSGSGLLCSPCVSLTVSDFDEQDSHGRSLEVVYSSS